MPERVTPSRCGLAQSSFRGSWTASGHRATIDTHRWSLDRSALRPPGTSASPDANTSREPEPLWPSRPPCPRLGFPAWASFGTFYRRHCSGAARGPHGPKRSRPDHSVPRSGSGAPLLPPTRLSSPAESRPGSAPEAVTRGQAEPFLVELSVAKCPSCSLRGKFWLWKITRPDARKVLAPGGQRRFLRLSQGGQGHGGPGKLLYWSHLPPLC